MLGGVALCQGWSLSGQGWGMGRALSVAQCAVAARIDMGISRKPPPMHCSASPQIPHLGAGHLVLGVVSVRGSRVSKCMLLQEGSWPGPSGLVGNGDKGGAGSGESRRGLPTTSPPELLKNGTRVSTADSPCGHHPPALRPHVPADLLTIPSGHSRTSGGLGHLQGWELES